YWQALLDDPRADAKVSGSSIGKLRLSQIAQHLLRVTCRRCGRIVEIQRSDAARLHGTEAIWKDVGQRLLDNTCTQRTGRHEEDGCWPRAPNGAEAPPDASLRRRPQGAGKGAEE